MKELEPKKQITTVRDVIISKEKRGADASFERELLRAWSKHEGFEYAKQALKDCDEK